MLKFGLFINKQAWTSFLSSRAWVVHDLLGSFTALFALYPKRTSLITIEIFCSCLWSPFFVAVYKVQFIAEYSLNYFNINMSTTQEVGEVQYVEDSLLCGMK